MNYDLSNSPLESGLTHTMIPFYAYQVAQGIKHDVIKEIERAVKCNDPRLSNIISDTLETYDAFMGLIKCLGMQGINLYPDDTWGDARAEMLSVFNVSQKDMLSELNQVTKDKLKSKGTIL